MRPDRWAGARFSKETVLQRAGEEIKLAESGDQIDISQKHLLCT